MAAMQQDPSKEITECPPPKKVRTDTNNSDTGNKTMTDEGDYFHVALGKDTVGTTQHLLNVSDCMDVTTQSQDKDVDIAHATDMTEQVPGPGPSTELDSDAINEGDAGYDDDILSEDDLYDDDENLNNAIGEGDDESTFQRTVLKERGNDESELLPMGWTRVIHNSGMPFYFHKLSRVCTMSKPYVLSGGGIHGMRGRHIPLSAIPCLHYRRELQKEQRASQAVIASPNGGSNAEKQGESAEIGPQKNSVNLTDDQTKSMPSIENRTSSNTDSECPVTQSTVVMPVIPNAGIVNMDSSDSAMESATGVTSVSLIGGIGISATNQAGSSESTPKGPALNHSLDVMAVRNYCMQLFEFRTVQVKKFKTPQERRIHIANLKIQKRIASQLPAFTREEQTDKSTCVKMEKKEFLKNLHMLHGKSYVSILHEYVQSVMQLQPKYIFKDCGKMHTPYGTTVVIDEVVYGTGYASNKKSAKDEAARLTLAILLPDMPELWSTTSAADKHMDTEYSSLLEEMAIEDPRVQELSSKASQRLPFHILLESIKIKRFGDRQPMMHLQSNQPYRKNTFVMTVGEHTVTAECSNKREGKHLASQAMLQLLHPLLKTWGELLHLYTKPEKTTSVQHRKRSKPAGPYDQRGWGQGPSGNWPTAHSAHPGEISHSEYTPSYTY